MSLSETKVNGIDTNWFPNFVAFTAKKCSRTSSFGGIHGIAVIIKAHIAGLNDEQSKRTCNLEAQFNLGDDANSFINGKLTIE